MTYKIDPAHMPAELFAVTRERIRSGHGPVRVVPTEVVTVNSAPWAYMARPNGTGSASVYPEYDLYPTLEEARRAGLSIVQREERMERKRHEEVMARLRAAARCCDGIAT